MNKKVVLMTVLLSLVVLGSLAGAYARKDDDACIPQPSQALGIAAVTEGISFLIAGGIGPLLILGIVFLIGLVISYFAFSGF